MIKTHEHIDITYHCYQNISLDEIGNNTMAKKQTTTNPLLSRIGSNTKTVKTTKTTKNTDTKTKNTKTSSKTNPLADALHKGSINTMTLSDRIRPVGDKSNKSKPKANKPSVKVEKKTKTVAPVSFTKYVEKVKNQQNNKPKSTTQLPKIKTTQPKTKVLSFKSTQEKKFLVIKNLEIGTSVADLKRVLANMGPLTDVRVKDLPSGSTTAEVEFQSDKSLQGAVGILNGAVADGRVIQAEITKR